MSTTVTFILFCFLCLGTNGTFNSVTASLGFKHKAKGVVDSIVNGKELEKFILEHM